MIRHPAFLLLPLFLMACVTGKEEAPVRAIWVTRFDYRSEEDVRTILERCGDAGFNRVMFQVRGNGTVFFPSQIEPWAEELGGRDPGFDPLAVAIDEATAQDIALHAWVNVYPSWRGIEPSSDPNQLYRNRPEWHWYDRDGKRQPLVENFYVSLNPCLPEVREYLVSVFREIMHNYDVDGLHLDYIRFVDELVSEDYPRDSRSLQLFAEETGGDPDLDPELWNHWRAEQITKLVESIASMMNEESPDSVLSAAVGSSPEGSDSPHLRSSREWAERGLLDAVYPMNYTKDPTLFAERAFSWGLVLTTAQIVTGMHIGPDRSIGVLREEFESAVATSPHLCLFAYSFLFPAAENPASTEELEERREEVLELLESVDEQRNRSSPQQLIATQGP